LESETLSKNGKVVVARELLPAGADLLTERFEVARGGLDVTRPRLLDLAPGADALVADLTVSVDDELLDACGEGLRIVANFAVGYDNVDLEACRGRGVAVTNTPDVLTNATAELAVTLTLAAARRLTDAERAVREGRWTGWAPGDFRGIELTGATVGIVGLGRIGARYGELLRGFGNRILYTARSPKPEGDALGAERVELHELLEASDVVSLHAPGGPETHHMIGREELDLIGPKGVLVNSARGTLVDTEALIAALAEGRLGAAGLDVFEGEPEAPAALLSAPRLTLAPHMGSATFAARDGMARMVAEDVIAVLEGREPAHRVA
jgi:glyoxylate reductase